MNKKILAGLLAVILVLSLVLVGCSRKSGESEPDQFASSGTGVEDWDEIVVSGNESGNSQSGSQSGSSSGSQSGSQSGGQSSSGNASVPSDGSKVLTYKEYMALSPAEQQAYFESFKSFADYVTWYNNAKKAYDANQDAIRIEGDGGFNIGDYIN